MKQPAALLFIAVFATLVFLRSPAPADIYKYVDENGQPHYTNSPEAIPPQYRQTVDRKQEIDTPSASRAPADALPAKDPAGENSPSNDFGADKVAALKARKLAIQKEFEALKAEQAELLRMKAAAVSEADTQACHQKMVLFEERFDAFHKERKTFEKENREYNEQVRQNMEKALQDLKEKEKRKKEAGASN